MKRREFIAAAVDAPAGDQPDKQRKFKTSEFANRRLPIVPRSSAGLEPYAGPWGTTQISHLLRRTMFGLKPQDVTAVSGLTGADLVNQLLTVGTAPDPPLNTNAGDTGSPVGTLGCGPRHPRPGDQQGQPRFTI